MDERSAFASLEPLTCGHRPLDRDARHAPPGYAVLREYGGERQICYDCAADLDREAARAGKPIVGYLVRSPRHNGAEIATWSGRRLGDVTYAREYAGCAGTSRHRYKMMSVRAVIEGREYAGVGHGYGQYVKLRPRRKVKS